MCKLWLHTSLNYKRECHCYRVFQKGLLHIFTSDKVNLRSSITESR